MSLVRSVVRLLAGSFAPVLLLALLLGAAGTAQAAQSFDQSAFAAAQKAGKPILIDVAAPWCPTCRAQKPIIAKLAAETPQLVVFEVDFDTRKDVLKQFRVQYQSTLIVFRGDREVARSTGDTSEGGIRELIARGL